MSEPQHPQFDRRQQQPVYQCKHEAEIGELRIRQESVQLQMAEIIGKLNVIIEQGTQQLLKIALLEQETKQHWREIESVNKDIDTFKRDMASEVVAVKKAHSDLDKLFHRYLYIGTGLWIAFVGACYMIGDKPLKQVEKLVNQVDSHDRYLEEIRGNALGRLQQTDVVREKR